MWKAGLPDFDESLTIDEPWISSVRLSRYAPQKRGHPSSIIQIPKFKREAVHCPPPVVFASTLFPGLFRDDEGIG